MRRTVLTLLLACQLLLATVPADAYTYQFTSGSAQLRWTNTTITVALSSSLSAPPANIKSGSDVVEAARRALRRWSDAANIQFVIQENSPLQTLSPLGAGDSVSLITVSPANSAEFSSTNRPGRSRIFFSSSGSISEADVALNPNPDPSNFVLFSTDGTPGTYDLESTFVHELGHLLGLDHSGAVGATMQPRQSRNANNRFTTNRTLSDDDLAGIRSIYGRRNSQPVGSVAGRVNYGAGAHVWVEKADTGRIAGSSITRSDGSYRIDQLPPGNYRVNVEYLDDPVVAAEITPSRGPYTGIGGQPAFRTAESQASVAADTTTTLDLNVQLGAPAFNLRALGIDGVAPNVASTIAAGGTYRLYIGGDNVDQIAANNFTVLSPFMRIEPASRVVESGFPTPYPVVSFNLIVTDSAKYGDYSVRAQNGAEVNYVVGGLALDPYTDFVELNPLENHVFFVSQQYRDFLFREPESGGLQAWLNVLNCSDVNNNPNCDRIHVSSAFFRSEEFQLKGFFVFRFYKAAFGRFPFYAEIIPDMVSVTGATPAEVAQRRAAYAVAITQRGEFVNLYAARSHKEYVDELMNRYNNLSQITTPDPANPDGTARVTLTRAELVNRLGSSTNALSRAQVLRAVVESNEVAAAEFNNAFVAMQYFGYLKRDPEQDGYNAWLRVINNNPNDFRIMVSGFFNSAEYRSRFGQP